MAETLPTDANSDDERRDSNTTVRSFESFSFTAPRRIVREGSVILANTGQRIRRTFTINNERTNSDESTPLLPVSNETVYEESSLSPLTMESLWNWLLHIDSFLKRDDTKSVLKCSLTYFLASLCVYYTPLSALFGKSDSKHVIATVTVNFHPSRTKGSMHQSLVFIAVSFLFGFSVSFGCRFISSWFYIEGNDWVSHGIDLVIASISLGTISLWKQFVNKPSFNTASGLSCIAVVGCIIKEGSTNAGQIPYQRIQAICSIVMIGCAVSVLMCYLLWPTSAVDELKHHLNETFGLMSSILSSVSSKFLLGESVDSTETNELYAKYKKSITSLKQSLEEASYELKLQGREAEFESLVNLVSATRKVGYDLLGLRSSADIQWKLLHEEEEAIDSSASTLASDTSLILSESMENMDRVNTDAMVRPVDFEIGMGPSHLFDLFVYFLAPSAKSLIFTVKDILRQIPFEGGVTTIQIQMFQNSLRIANELYVESQSEAFSSIYSQKLFTASEFEAKADQEEVAASCGNFASLLGQFSKDLQEFLVLLEHHPDSFSSPRSFEWVKFWKKKEEPTKYEKIKLQEVSLNGALARFQTQSQMDMEQSYNYRLWRLLKIFRSTDVQFGIRVGIGCFCISILAFLPETKATFQEWRGEWVLIVYTLMMNKSLGGTSMTVKWRFVGTFVGAYGALLVWRLLEGNALGLAIAGFLISIPCFYIILIWTTDNAIGRFVLLTYNLTALYSFSMTQKDHEDDREGGDNPIIETIAFHRFVAVSSGALFALLMSAVFLPNSARSRLKQGLILIWLRMGIIWNSDPLSSKVDEVTKETVLIGLRDRRGVHMIMTELETLLKQAPKEFRLKGYFPLKQYEKLLKSTSKIMDAFQNMTTIIELDPILSEAEEYAVMYIKGERNELEHRIFLNLYMIASALKLGLPLPSQLTSTEHAKDRMLAKLSEIRTQYNHALSNEDYVLLYSYILVTSTITDELIVLRDLTRELLGQVTEETFELA